MRIALVCPYSLAVSGGVQNHVLGLAHWLGGQGHEAFVLAPEAPRDELRARYHRARVSSSGRALSVRYNGSVARVSFDPFTATRVSRWLAEVDPAVVHVHEPITPSVSLLALRQAAPEAAVLATFHTATPRSRSMRLARRVFPGTIARIDAAISVSRHAQRVARRHIGVDSQIIGNGFDFEEFAAPGRLAAPSNGPVISYLGRLNEPRKGLQVLIDAWPAIRASHRSARLLLAGTGRVSVPADWTMLGRVGDAERSRLLRSSDVFVAPHLARESFGLVLMEALAAGAGVVASDLPAFVDVLSDRAGPVATMFRTGDADALAAGVGRELARRTPGTARRGAALARRYDWSVVGPQIAEQYVRAVEGRAAPRIAYAG